MQKGQIFIWILVGALVIAVTGGYFIYTNYSNNQAKPVIQNLVPVSGEDNKIVSPDNPDNWSCGKLAGPAGDATCPSGYTCDYSNSTNPDIGTCTKDKQLDETANWKTYTNDEFKFSFKYHPLFTFVKDTKLVFDSTNFDNQKVSVTQYFFVFTTGKILNGQMVGDPGLKGEWQDESSVGVNIIQTNGKTIMQAYNNKQGIGNEITKVTFLDKTGGADEVAKVSGIQNHIRVYRKGNYFFEIGSPQSNAVLPDGSDDILTYINQILSTFKFI